MKSTRLVRAASALARRLAPALLAALLALAVPERAGAQLAWTFSDCASQQGDAIVISTCGSFCPFVSTATVVSPVQGTLTMRLDYQLGFPATYEQLRVSTPTEGLYALPWSELWCAPTPCSGSNREISAHLLAGEPLQIWFSGGDFCGTTSTATFSGITFVADVGFVSGPGALDGRVLLHQGGAAQYDELGQDVAFIQDLDGDGLDDLVARGKSTGNKVWFLSSATGATLFTAQGAPLLTSGSGSLAVMGDLDGDGLEDAVLGGNPARVLSGADGHVLMLIPSTTPGEGLGASVGAIGDLDADGVPDVLIGATGAKVGGVVSGAVRVYSGALGTQVLLEVGGNLGDWVGSAVGSPGDITGDGIPDLYAGAEYADLAGPSSGAVRLHSGADGSLLAELTGPVGSTDHFGIEVAAAGDLDGDGVGDVVGGAPYNQEFPAIFHGSVLAFSGTTGALLFSVDGGPVDQLGTSVTGIGDWDGDGRDDVIAGSSPYANGYAIIISGATHDVLQKLSMGPNPPTVISGDAFGYACAGGGDADGDGRTDIVIGQPSLGYASTSTSYASTGAVHVFSGDGADYQPPTLEGLGSLVPLSAARLTIAAGDANASAYLVTGASKANLPFKSGLLVPAPTLVLSIPLDGAGEATLLGTWPAGIPVGASVWLQAWLPDADGPAEFRASASLQIIQP